MEISVPLYSQPVWTVTGKFMRWSSTDTVAIGFLISAVNVVESTPLASDIKGLSSFTSDLIILRLTI